MWSFLRDLARDLRATYTVLLLDEEGLGPPRRHAVQPRQFFGLWAGSAVALALVLVGLVVFTPLREIVPGSSTAEIRRDARLNALRLAALQDSLAAQQRYMDQVRRLMLGEVDPGFEAAAAPDEAVRLAGEPEAAEAVPADWSDHEQPALPLERLASGSAPAVRVAAAAEARYLSSLQFPAPPPVNGFVTRGFDARIGHFAIDIAAEEGTVVRSVGEGHVIFADWTQEGGFVTAIQHADGYVSVYKHSSRLLKRAGERVRDREPVAMSGNTGEVTTGPHVHFELWHDGLAQDPRYFLIGE